MKNKLTKALFLGLFILTGANSHAAIGLFGGPIGGLGMTFGSGSSVTSYAIGGRAGFRFAPSLQVAGEWTYQPTTPSGAAAGYTANVSVATASFDYVFTGMIDGLFAGAKVGVGFPSAGGTVGTSMAFGAEAGYDFRFGPISAGPQVNYLYIMAPSGGTASSVFQALAAVKYWL